jgi:hypothetical protein
VNTKKQGGYSSAQETQFKDANTLVSDAVINHQTVASFGDEELIVETFMSKLEGPLNTGIKGAHITAVIYVASQMV